MNTTPEQRRADIVERFPNGLIPEQFRTLTLESADDDGRVYPPALADFFTAYSLLLGMWMKGLIDSPGGKNNAVSWFITAKGRAALSTIQNKAPQHE